MGWMGRTGPVRSSRAFRFGLSAAAATLFVTLGAAAPAFAAGPPNGHGHGPPGTSGGGTVVTKYTGSDISFPQCGGSYPKAAFGIVGVNDGRPNELNPCLGPTGSTAATKTELYWAVNDVTNADPQSVSPSLYVNTADPGDLSGHTPVADWPSSGTAGTTYGTCTAISYRHHKTMVTIGVDSTACAWLYGYEKATQDMKWLATAATRINNNVASTKAVPSTPAAYPWWLDVETANTWQTGTTGVAMNVAVLQGLVTGLQQAGATVGVYSTSYQWGQIAGTTTSSTKVLYKLPDWIPGATSSNPAKMCSAAPFTGGSVLLSQWTGTFDEDRAC